MVSKKNLRLIQDKGERNALQSLINQYNLQDFNVRVKDGHLEYIAIKFKGLSEIPKEIAKFVELRHLDLSHNQIRVIDELTSLIHLRKLDLRENKIEYIQALEPVVLLEDLDLSENPIRMISGLDNQRRLVSLDLSRCQISTIEKLDRCLNLRVLKLNDNPISKLENLDGLRHLEVLLLARAQIQKIEGLEELSNLRELNLGMNQIHQIEGLERNNLLRKLNLADNQIRVIENIEHLSFLDEIHLERNKLSPQDLPYINYPAKEIVQYSQQKLAQKMKNENFRNKVKAERDQFQIDEELNAKTIIQTTSTTNEMRNKLVIDQNHRSPLISSDVLDDDTIAQKKLRENTEISQSPIKSPLPNIVIRSKDPLRPRKDSELDNKMNDLEFNKKKDDEQEAVSSERPRKMSALEARIARKKKIQEQIQKKKEYTNASLKKTSTPESQSMNISPEQNKVQQPPKKQKQGLSGPAWLMGASLTALDQDEEDSNDENNFKALTNKEVNKSSNNQSPKNNRVLARRMNVSSNLAQESSSSIESADLIPSTSNVHSQESNEVISQNPPAPINRERLESLVHSLLDDDSKTQQPVSSQDPSAFSRFIRILPEGARLSQENQPKIESSSQSTPNIKHQSLGSSNDLSSDSSAFSRFIRVIPQNEQSNQASKEISTELLSQTQETNPRTPNIPDTPETNPELHNESPDNETHPDSESIPLPPSPSTVRVPVPNPIIQSVLGKEFSTEDEWLSYGNLLNVQEDYSNALLAYRNAIQLNTRNFVSWMNSGIAFNNKGDYSRAGKALKQALAISPSNAEIWTYLGIVNYNQGEFEEATNALQQALQLNPNLSLAHQYFSQIPEEFKQKLALVFQALEQLSLREQNSEDMLIGLIEQLRQEKTKIPLEELLRDEILNPPIIQDLSTLKIFIESLIEEGKVNASISNSYLEIIEEPTQEADIDLEENYDIVRLLAFTNFSQLWLAREIETGEEFVLKHIIFRDLRTRKIIESLALREINILKHFNSSHIIPLLEYSKAHYHENWGYVLKLPYFEAGTLDHRIRTIIQQEEIQLMHPLGVLAIFIGLLEAVMELHQNNIIHRDIKPSNIIINSYSPNPNPRDIVLIDFGIAASPQELADSSLNISGLGTIGFSAPEQLEHSTADFSSDYYAIAATILYLVTLKKFDGTFFLPDYTHRYYQSISSIFPKLMQMMDLDPMKRIRKIDEIATLIQELYALAQKISS